MHTKTAFVLGCLLGALGVYAWSANKLLFAQEKINTPPRKITKQEWWENHQPKTNDEYQLTLARRNWLRYFFSTFIYPYIDKNVATVLASEFLSPLNNQLTLLEIQQEDKERLSELMLMQKMASEQNDD